MIYSVELYNYQSSQDSTTPIKKMKTTNLFTKSPIREPLEFRLAEGFGALVALGGAGSDISCNG